jgi:hypothetical protein
VGTWSQSDGSGQPFSEIQKPFAGSGQRVCPLGKVKPNQVVYGLMEKT